MQDGTLDAVDEPRMHEVPSSRKSEEPTEMHPIAAYKPVAYETLTNTGRRVRFHAHDEPELSIDAMDAATGEVLGEVRVWDGHPVHAECRRMLTADEWSLESPVAAEIIALNDAGEFYVAVNPRLGTLEDVFDCLLTVTVVSDDDTG